MKAVTKVSFIFPLKIMNVTSHEGDDRREKGAGSDKDLILSADAGISRLPIAVDFVRQIMPSEEAYIERAQMYPNTYGNPEWVEIRVSQSISALSQRLSTRSTRVAAVFDLLGIRNGSEQENDVPTPSMSSILEQFSAPSDRHRAISAYVAITTNLVNGYTNVDDWDPYRLDMQNLPQQKHASLQVDNEHSISLLYAGHEDWLLNTPPEYMIDNLDYKIVDLESLRLEVLKSSKDSNGIRETYESNALPQPELQQLIRACCMQRMIDRCLEDYPLE